MKYTPGNYSFKKNEKQRNMTLLVAFLCFSFFCVKLVHPAKYAVVRQRLIEQETFTSWLLCYRNSKFYFYFAENFSRLKID